MTKSSTGKVKKSKAAVKSKAVSSKVDVKKPAKKSKSVAASSKTENVKKITKQTAEKAKAVTGVVKTSWSKAKVRLYKLGIGSAIAIVFAIPVCGVVVRTIWKAGEYQNFQSEQGDYYTAAKEKFAQLYTDTEAEIPVEDVSEEKVAEVEGLLQRIKYKEYVDDKDAMLAKLEVLRKFLPVRDEVLAVFDGEAMKSGTTNEEIAALKEKVATLDEGQQQALEKRLGMLETQRVAIDELRTAVAGLFTDGAKNNIRADVTQVQYNAVADKWNALLQEDVKAEQKPYLDKVKAEVDRKAEEARKAAEEARKKREAEIAAAWHTLNVPYISQNRQGVSNGCEAAALLMGLQYKGYLGGMTLPQYAEMMPKSDDPNTGFRGRIFDKAGDDAPFWIAPAPLAAFGRSSSGANVQDITGSSLIQLKNEVLAGNPVVIYLTFNYTAPGAWRVGAPTNLHVMLLTGWNAVTNELQTTDPWTGAGGKTKYTLSWSQVESIYNKTGKRAVVIR